MNNIITLPDIAAYTARIAGVDNDTATRFIVELFARVEAALAAGNGVVDVPGIGSFCRDAAASCGIRFSPDKALAEAINAPFALFSPIVLPENAPTEIFADTESEQPAVETLAEPPSEQKETTAEVPLVETLPVAEPEPLPEPKTEPKTEPGPISDEQPPCTEGKSHVVTLETFPAAETEIVYVARHSKWPWIAALIALAAGFAAGYIIGSRNTTEPIVLAENAITIVPDTTSIERTDTAAIARPDSAALSGSEKQDVAVSPADEPVYDTVSPTRFLTTIARDHYGRKDFWVFIYEANADHLRHPNRIRPGTKVLVPNLGPHAALDTALRARAQSLASDIYRRYDM